MIGESRKLAVLGSPIAHSKSPALHRAAYGVLGLGWSYEAIQISEEELRGFVESRDELWLGLSLTMPLKRAAIPLLDRSEELVALTGSVNTIRLDTVAGGRVVSGYNTDIHGLAQSFRQAGMTALGAVQILGGGATAASAIVAVSLLQASEVTVLVRDVSRASGLVAVGESVGVSVSIMPITALDSLPPAELVISTLPGGTLIEHEFASTTIEHTILFDVAYDPWPSALARSWNSAGGKVISGIHMLINQALIQIRLFVSGDAYTPLPREAEVVAAMRSAVGVESLWDNS